MFYTKSEIVHFPNCSTIFIKSYIIIVSIKSTLYKNCYTSWAIVNILYKVHKYQFLNVSTLQKQKFYLYQIYKDCITVIFNKLSDENNFKTLCIVNYIEYLYYNIGTYIFLNYR